MSTQKGITTWVLRAGSLGLAYRWNMSLKDALRTFHVMFGRHMAVACGPLIIEWKCRFPIVKVAFSSY